MAAMAVSAHARGDAENNSRATGSATGDASRPRTLSNVGSDVDVALNSTMLPGVGRFGDAADDQDPASTAALRALVARLERLQVEARSVQQPNKDVDVVIEQAICSRPEQRARMAVMTKSPWLRKKILSCQYQGGRSVGSSTLGATYHWRSEKLQGKGHFGDHNWPKVAVNLQSPHTTASFLPGGDKRHTHLLRCPVEKIPIHPTLSHSQSHSMPKDKRWHGCHENGELDKAFRQRREPPGPGAYHKSLPRGPSYTLDAGETIIVGANSTCPWKSPMGNSINPTDVHAHSEHHSAPKWSFSKTRRTVSDTRVGHGVQDGGPVKTDQGCLSPGLIYTHYSSFRTGPPLGGKRRTRSNPNLRKMKCEPVPPEPEGAQQQGASEAEERAFAGY